ncbi:tripartite-type tricarboxylate transporter receptor subunit TctC [Rhizobium sp. SLBN-94]|nr:tripartite-type tricarboxylate transporter receptor subunit TctC [Rhizobium sp. SLBN-94]
MFKAFILIAAILAATPSVAQDFPNKPVKIVVAFNPGGLTDLLARITADFLQKRLGQAVVVENRPGASGAVAADYVAKAKPDGYTLMVTAADLAVLPAVRANLPYSLDNFTYLTKFWTTGTMIVVGPDSPVSSMPELIDRIKSNPGKVRYGTTGVASLNHLGTAKLLGAIDGSAVHVPYTGQGPITTDLLANVVDFYTGGSVPFPNNLKVLAPAGSVRSQAYPDLPTLQELGYENASYDAWFGVIAPPNLPEGIADKLNSELEAVFTDPEAIAKFRDAAKQEPDKLLSVGRDFKQYVLDQNKGWKEIAQQQKIEVQQ